MKIALIIKHYSIHQGGAERYAVDLSQALMKEGHEVHVVANHFEPHGPHKPGYHHVPVVKKPAWLRVLSFSRRARKILEKENFDVVYALTQIYPQDIYLTGGGVYRHWMRVRYPSAPHRRLAYLSRPIHLANVYLEKQLYRSQNNKIIVANSLLCKRHVQQYWGVSEDRIRIIYHGVDHSIFNPESASRRRSQVRQSLGLTERIPTILFVSNNWKRKGLVIIVHALGKLKVDGLRFNLVVVGRGNPKSYKRLAEKFGITNSIHFIGHTNDILPYYGIADLVVLPTLYDSFGNVVIEAMACGVAVITSTSSGVSELLEDGVSGYILKNARDSEELAELLKLCSNLPKLRAMGEAARQVSLKYTPERNAQETLEVCHEICAQKKREKSSETRVSGCRRPS